MKKIIQISLNLFLFLGMLLPIVSFSAQPTFDFSDPASGGTLSNVGYVQTTTTTTTNAVSCQKTFTDLADIFNYVTCTIGNSVIPLLFAVALVVFFYGVVKYVIAADGSDDREEGRWFMVYGVVGLFVMVSVWGLVKVISNTFNISTSLPPQF